MKQYNAIKAKHPGALLLFRVGDFYETFDDDAQTCVERLSFTQVIGEVLSHHWNVRQVGR